MTAGRGEAHAPGPETGTPENPWRLGDEYCVLGDFAARSSDSRAWGPVPRGNVEGVVVLRYFPLARWKVLP